MQRPFALLLSAAVASALVLSAGAIAGCVNVSQDGSGTTTGSTATQDTSDLTGSVGTFEVSATLTQTTCGQGALGMANTWSFAVALNNDDGTCTWNTGTGPLDGTCPTMTQGTFEATTTVDMRAGDTSLPACSILRDDVATLTLNSVDDPESFNGTLTYNFSPTANSDCSDLYLGDTPQFLTLPCHRHLHCDRDPDEVSPAPRRAW